MTPLEPPSRGSLHAQNAHPMRTLYPTAVRAVPLRCTLSGMATRKRKPRKPRSIPENFEPGFLAQLDQRSKVTIALRTNYDTIIDDLGGPDAVSHIKAGLVERFVWLHAVLQSLEHELVSSPEMQVELLGKWSTLINSLLGLARTLGIERVGTSKLVNLYTDDDEDDAT